MKFAEWADRLLAVLYPRRCVLCGKVTAYDELICDSCAFTRAGVFPVPRGGPLSGVLAAVEYGGNIRNAVWRLKDQGDPRCLQFFAGEMFSAMNGAWDGIRFHCLTPVPTNAARRASRGFNQAQLLAEHLSGLTGIPVEPGGLIRRENSQVQHSLNAEQRRQNAESSYELAEDGVPRGKTILLVDDVMTTGATLSACAKLLVAAGALRVYGVTATKTPLR